jgi:hypothetical protein
MPCSHVIHLAGFIFAADVYSLSSKARSQLIFFSDEAWFHLQGYINTQNYCHRSSDNTHLTHKVLLYKVKVSVWCAGARMIAGPTMNFL